MKTFNHIGLDPIELRATMVEGKRLYATPEGDRFPSVTTVISNNAKKKQSIARWRERVGKEKADNISARSTSRGTKFHSIVEDYLNNRLDLKRYGKYPLPVLMFQHSIQDLDRINNIYLQEAALYSRHLELAGRVDCIAEFDGVRSIIDFKTSKRIKKKENISNYFAQASAYAIMFEERTGMPIPNTVILMDVDYEKPLVFKEHRDNYTKLLTDTIDEYRKRKLFSH